MPVYVPPQIQIEPETLAFGAYNPNLPLMQQAAINLTIRNIGGATLDGRLVPQVSWLIINPLGFSLEAGQSSQHVIQISTGAPQQINKDQHFFQNGVIITSNAGPSGLDVSYTLDYHQKPYTPPKMELTPRNQRETPLKILPMLAVIAFIVMAIVGIRLLFQESAQDEPIAYNREDLLTQGAQTVFAESGLVTETPEPDAAFIRQATPTTLSLFEPLTTDTPDLTATAFQPTFTPWPTGQFLSPEVIVTSYFDALISGDYPAAWQFLTRDYQEDCCSALGTDPYYIFARDWSAVTDIQLISAFLQEYDLNPAPVLVRYQYRNVDDELQEFTQMFWLIVNEDQTSLLINAVDVLQEN